MLEYQIAIQHMKEEMTMVIEGYKNVIRWYPPKKFPAIKFPKLTT